MSRVVLATGSVPFEQRVRAALDGVLSGTLQVLPRGPLPPDPGHLLELVTGADTPEVIVLGPGVPTDGALLLAARLDEQYPGISLVLVTDPDSDVWLAAMRAGVRDVLNPDSDVEEIRVVLDRAIQVALGHRKAVDAPAEAATRTGQVIAVVSPKGGTGKTTIATNLAVGLARRAPQETVIVDLDLQFGDVASALQLVPEYTVADAVQGPTGQDAMVLKTYLSSHVSGLYALCAPESPADADGVTGEQVAQILELLAADFRYVVVDTAPGLGDHALAALDRATDIVLVSGMDVPSVRGLRKELDVLKQLDLRPSSQHIVLNSADRRGGMSVKDVAATIGAEVDVVIPASRAVLLSTNQGIPLLQNEARGPVAKELRRLVDRLTTESAEASSELSNAIPALGQRSRFRLRGAGAQPLSQPETVTG